MESEVCLANPRKLKIPKKEDITQQELSSVFEKTSGDIEEEKEEIIELMVKETGSPKKFLQNQLVEGLELLNNVDNLNLPNFEREIIHEPKGTILITISANEPIDTSFNTIVPALYSGNQVLVKPSTKAPSFTHYLVKKLIENGVPQENLHLIPFSKEKLEDILKLNELDAIFWSGSSRSAKIVGSKSISKSKEFIPEAGGNSWCYVSKDAEIEDSADKIISFTQNSGQMCNALRGVLVQESVKGELVKELSRKLETLNIGDPRDSETDVGPLQTKEQVKDIKEKLKNAEKGQKLDLVNSKTIEPVLVENVGWETELVGEGVFGPVLWVNSVKDFEEACEKYENYNSHGLTFSVFTSSNEVIQKAKSRINCSKLCINRDPTNISMTEPWGGVQKSGNNGAVNWLEKFTNRKHVKYDE